MAGFKHMVSMEQTDMDRLQNLMAEPIASARNVPPGLCIVLTESELDKLGLDADCEVGDMLHISAMTRVTGVNKNDTGAGPRCRVDLAITDMAVENEDTEAESDED